MSKYCLGCGVLLQDKEEKDLGYVKDMTKDYCMRCFRLTHYHELSTSLESKSSDVLKKINASSGFAFFFCDFLNLYPENIAYYHKITLPKVFIVTKKDTIPKSIYYLKIKEWLQKDFKIKDGSVSIRCNDTNELLIYIKTKDNIVIPEIPLNVVGIVLNDKVLRGNYYITEIVNGYKYNVSYNSFFQVNLGACAKMFDLLDKYILKDSNVLDLYCGVGTLGLSVAKNEKMVYGIEIVSNAIKNAWDNAKLNNISNVKYYCGDVSKVISRIENKIDVIITDPPRSGLDKKTIEVMMKLEPKEIIYISCDPITLARDLKLLDGYSLKYITGLDMFSYTNHVECVSVLYRKSLEK